LEFLIIIDVQKGFINQWTRHIPARVEALQDAFGRVLATRFYNPPGSFHRRLIGWGRFAKDSKDFELAFRPRADAAVRDKPTYTCIDPELLADVRRDGFGAVHLCGIATDNCVLKSAVDLFEAGIRPVVIADAAASHGGPACHEAGLLLLRRFIGAGQVVETEQLNL